MPVMSSRLVLLIVALAAVVHAAPTPAEHHVVHERREVLSSAWVKRDRLSGDRYLPVRIGLAQSELENAEYHLMAISHPESPEYGNHWDREKVIETFRPSYEAESQVRQWLIDHGIDSERIAHSADKTWFGFHALVDEAEALLATEFHEYEHVDTGKLSPSCEQYHLPKHISPHVDFITPGIHLFAPPKKIRVTDEVAPEVLSTLERRDQAEAAPAFNKSDLSICDFETTPACIAALYNIPPTSGSPHPNNSMGIFEGNLEFWEQSDLNAFFTNYTNIPNGTHPIAGNIDGGEQTMNSIYYAGAEVTIDLQIAYPIIYPQSIVNYDVDDLLYQSGLVPPIAVGGFDTFFDALDGSFCNFTAYNQTGDSPLDPVYPDPYGAWQGQRECGTQKPTNVISISYGAQEVDVAVSYQRRQCLEYLKLGLQGVSILVSSGDFGTANLPAEYVTAGNTPGCIGSNADIFSPTWPSNCPWITSVGATRLWDGQKVTDPESAMARPAILPGHPLNASSGGGFSNLYTQPDYQKTAIENYFQEHDPGYSYYSSIAINSGNISHQIDPDYLAGNTGGIYNRIGRGYPDVSAIGIHGTFIIGGEYIQYLGTSLSAPLFGGVITRINEERLNAGKKTLGFLNPSLYANTSMFNDIKNGTNFGCEGTEVGFKAVSGWDPVTGLGTPNFPKMVEYLMNLP